MPESAPLNSRNEITSARCPRCGYDLRGAMELWCESCPIFGVCSECGLNFEWADLLSTWRVRPRWNVEFPLQLISFPINVPRTLICSFWPWTFFSSLKMHHEFRPLRIVGYLMVLFCLPYVILIAGVGHEAWKQYEYSENSIGATMNVSPVFVVAQAMTFPLSSQPPGTMTVRASNRNVRWLISGGKAVPVIFKGMPAYHIPLDTPAELFKSKYRFRSDSSFWEVSHGLILSSGGTSWKLQFEFLLLATVFSGLCPLGFVLLPKSRQVAKVRREHLIRITLYSFAFIAILIIRITLGFTLGREYAIPGNEIRLVWLFILPLVHLVWWSVAIERYLKMPHAWGVGASVVVIAYLLGPVLLACVIIFLATIIS